LGVGWEEGVMDLDVANGSGKRMLYEYKNVYPRYEIVRGGLAYCISMKLPRACSQSSILRILLMIILLMIFSKLHAKRMRSHSNANMPAKMPSICCQKVTGSVSASGALRFIPAAPFLKY